jgi:hypothetical protein
VTVSLLEVWTNKGLLLIAHFVIKCSLEISPHSLSTVSSPLNIIKDLTTCQPRIESKLFCIIAMVLSKCARIGFHFVKFYIADIPF